MFFVDRVNVKTSWESSLWIADGVTQLLSTRNLKEIVGKDKLVRSKLLEELNSPLFGGSSQAKFFSKNYLINRPLLHRKRGYL